MSGSLSSLFVFIYNEIAAVLELEHGHVQLLPVPPEFGKGWLVGWTPVDDVLGRNDSVPQFSQVYILALDVHCSAKVGSAQFL